MIDMTKQQIDEIFALVENSNDPHQADILLGLYKVAFPEWDAIKFIDGWPRLNPKTSQYIAARFIAFDRKFHESLPGGLWLNKGFSSHDEVPEWTIDLEGCEVTLV